MSDIELQRATGNGQIKTLKSGQGNVQLRDPVTNHLILIPRPSEDPKDPLNW